MFGLIKVLAIAAVAMPLAHPASAQTQFPERAIRMVVPYPPGGGMDAVTRSIAPKVSESIGKPVIVDNRAGGSGFIGIQAVTQAPPDGYTLMTHALGFAVNPAVYRKLQYDAVKDIQPVAMIGFTPVFIAINPKLEAKTLPEFIALAKKHPKKFKGATFGFGASRLMMESFKLQTGIDAPLIPYNGTAPAVLSAMAGETDFVIMDAASVQQHIVSGSLRGLAVASESRVTALPDMPTTKEAGLPSYVVEFWYAMFTRGGTPPEIVKKLNAEINKAVMTPEVSGKLQGLGIVPTNRSVDQFSKYYLDEIERWKDVVKRANVPPAD